MQIKLAVNPHPASVFSSTQGCWECGRIRKDDVLVQIERVFGPICPGCVAYYSRLSQDETPAQLTGAYAYPVG